VLKNLRRIGWEQVSADVRLATGFAAEQIRASDCGGWAVARVPERALVPHADRPMPEMIWHIASCCAPSRTRRSPLARVNYGVIYSSVVPAECWPAGGQDSSIDDNARDLLLSMGVNEAAATIVLAPAVYVTWSAMAACHPSTLCVVHTERVNASDADRLLTN
jgi:hypothetical protein